MVSARRAISGTLILLLGSYLFFLKNSGFNTGLLTDTYELSFFYTTFALLAVTILAGFLLFKDLTVGSILAICCISVVLIWGIADLLIGWSGSIYTFEQEMRHLHRIAMEIVVPAFILTFGIVGISRGEE